LGAFLTMAQRMAKTPVKELLGYAVTGAGLGLFLALTAMISNPALFKLIAGSQYPRLAMLVFAGALSSVIAVGSTITGFVFSAVERS
jgi:hypothetical protein